MVYQMIKFLRHIIFCPRIYFMIIFLTSMVSCADDTSVAKNNKSTKQVVCEETVIATDRGSVGFMKNLAESEDSIRAIADKQLRQALEPEKISASSLSDGINQIQIVYRVKPIKFLPESEQDKVCLQLEKATTITPLQYGPKKFTSVTGLNEWIMSLSRGHGTDGKNLYEQCGSNCSPRYTFTIAAQKSGYVVNTDVLCGLARDTVSDQYELSTTLQKNCKPN